MRHPEPDLEVQWQRHAPIGVGPYEYQQAILNMTDEAREVMQDRHWPEFENADIVLTVSVRRPEV